MLKVITNILISIPIAGLIAYYLTTYLNDWQVDTLWINAKNRFESREHQVRYMKDVWEGRIEPEDEEDQEIKAMEAGDFLLYIYHWWRQFDWDYVEMAKPTSAGLSPKSPAWSKDYKIVSTYNYHAEEALREWRIWADSQLFVREEAAEVETETEVRYNLPSKLGEKEYRQRKPIERQRVTSNQPLSGEGLAQEIELTPTMSKPYRTRHHAPKPLKPRPKTKHRNRPLQKEQAQEQP